MKFKVIMLSKAKEEYEGLEQEQKNALDNDYKIIENLGLEFVKHRFLRDGLFEIKTNDIRSLFQYRKNQIILIGLVYTKKTRKTPKQLLELAQKRLGEKEVE